MYEHCFFGVALVLECLGDFDGVVRIYLVEMKKEECNGDKR